MRIFSGIQPTGSKTLGNYAGGFRQYVETQERGEAFFCIVDLHSITVEYDPAELRESTLKVFAMLVATGLDPGRSTIFAQSHVTAHAESAWLLSAVASYGQLGRMTQFKEKGERQEFVSAGLFTYPVLMAGDILLYQTDAVPVGDDQRQHIEFARDVAQSFNARFGETSRATSLYGFRIGSTCSTPGYPSSGSVASSSRSTIAPITVASRPCVTRACTPASCSRASTCSVWSAVAAAPITINSSGDPLVAKVF